MGTGGSLLALFENDRLAQTGDASIPRLPRSHEYSPSICVRASLRGRHAGGAISSSSSGLWLAARYKSGISYDALRDTPYTHDLRGHPNYGNRDG